MVCVLLTKLQHSCFSQLWVIVIWSVGVITWTTSKRCGMNPAVVHLRGSEGVPPPWLCTFRKSELWRGKTTDWVQDTQWAYYCTIAQIQNLIWNVEHIHLNSLPIVVRPTTANQCGQILQPSNSYYITQSEICTVSVHCNYLGWTQPYAGWSTCQYIKETLSDNEMCASLYTSSYHTSSNSYFGHCSG